MNAPGPAAASQSERTQLAWRRVLVGVLTAVGLGAVKLAFEGRHLGSALFGGAAVVAALVPIGHRLRQLRRDGRSAPTWQPAAITAIIVVLAVGLLVTA